MESSSETIILCKLYVQLGNYCFSKVVSTRCPPRCSGVSENTLFTRIAYSPAELATRPHFSPETLKQVNLRSPSKTANADQELTSVS